jgi:membrane protein
VLIRRRDADDVILAVVAAVAPPAGVEALRGPLQALSTIPLPGLALAIGVALTLWAVSAYAACFGRALNAFYSVEEGRPLWKVRATMLLLAVPLTAGGAVVATIVLTTPRIGTAVARETSVPDVWTLLWQVGKWPFLLLVLVLMLNALYRWTPNVRRRTRHPVGWGAWLSILGWAVLSSGFGLYVAGLDRYRVYGWLTGALVITLWLFLSNLVLVLGASLDTEVVRMQQLRAGIPAEQTLAAAVRDRQRSSSLAKRVALAEAESRALRLSAAARPAAPDGVRGARYRGGMAHRPGEPEGTPSQDAVEHDFSTPADPDVETGDDETQPA